MAGFAKRLYLLMFAGLTILMCSLTYENFDRAIEAAEDCRLNNIKFDAAEVYGIIPEKIEFKKQACEWIPNHRMEVAWGSLLWVFAVPIFMLIFWRGARWLIFGLNPIYKMNWRDPLG